MLGSHEAAARLSMRLCAGRCLFIADIAARRWAPGKFMEHGCRARRPNILMKSE